MKWSNIDLIQHWLFYDQLSEQQVHKRIKEYGVKIDVNRAIELGKIQKDYERGNVRLKVLTDELKVHDIS